MKRILSFTFAFSACLLLSSCAELFQGKVAMGTQSDIASLADVVVPQKKIEQLEAPRQVFASSGDSPSAITVSWTPVEGASSYRLERAIVTGPDENGLWTEPDESDYAVISGTSTSSATLYNRTSYTDTILSQNGMSYTAPQYSWRYYYRVSAENAFKGYGSSDFTVNIQAGTLFAPPTEVKASAGSSDIAINLSWTKSTSSTVREYSIYRSENEDGTNAAYITSVKSNMNHFSDPIAEQNRGVVYYYSIYAETVSGTKSCVSALAMGYARAEGAPPQVTGVKVSNGRGTTTDSIDISWDNVGAEHYAVYRSSSKDSALSLIAPNVTGTTFHDTTNLLQDVYYYYQVQSWAEDPNDANKKIKGQMSDSSKTATSPAEGFILSPPSHIAVSKNTSGSHMAMWEPAIGNADEQGHYAYIILGSESQTSGFNEVASVQAEELTFIDGMYYYEIPASSAKAFYKICTQNGGVVSVESAVTAPAPDKVRSVTVSRAANLSSEMGSDFAANANEVYPVKITWTPPANASDVLGYIVYRSDKKDRGFKKLSVGNDERTYIVSGTTFYDINASARPGKIYYYQVLSVNALEQGANYSDVVYGYGALTAAQYLREYNKTIMSSQKKLTLMHKTPDTAKLGSESINGAVCGSLSYSAGMNGAVSMPYSEYSDFYIHANGKQDASPLTDEDEPAIGSANGLYFLISGNTDTEIQGNLLAKNGVMKGTVNCRGMYPGRVIYNNIQIKGGAAGGGYYLITREGFAEEKVSWTVGNE